MPRGDAAVGGVRSAFDTPPTAESAGEFVVSRGGDVAALRAPATLSTTADAAAEPAEGIAVHLGGRLIARAALRRQLRRALGLVAVREIALDSVRFDGARADAAAGDVEGAVTALLRLIASEHPGWEVATLRPASHAAAAIDTAWRFAVRLGYLCEISGTATGDASSFVMYRPGARAALARLLRSVPSAALRRAASGRLHRAKNRARRPLETYSAELVYFVLEGGAHAPVVSPTIDVRFAEVDASDVLRAPLRYATDLHSAEYGVSAGHHCFAAYVRGEVVYHMWATADQAFVQGCFPLGLVAPPALYVYDCHTAPAYRGRRIYPASLSWLRASHYARSVDRLCLRVSRANTSSMRGVERAGFMRVG